MPDNVLSFLEGLTDSLMNFNLIPLSSLPVIDRLLAKADYEQSDFNLMMMELESGSTLVNLLEILGFYILVPIIHILIGIIYK